MNNRPSRRAIAEQRNEAMKDLGFAFGTKLVPNDRLFDHLSNRPMWNSVEVSFYREAAYIQVVAYKPNEGWMITLPTGGFTGQIPYEVLQSMERYQENE